MYRLWIYLSLALLIAGLFAGCGGNAFTSPTVTLTAAQKSIRAGQGVTLTWTSSYAMSITSSNSTPKR